MTIKENIKHTGRNIYIYISYNNGFYSRNIKKINKIKDIKNYLDFMAII